MHMCNILSIDRASVFAMPCFFFGLCLLVFSLLPCTFDGWVPRLDFYLQERKHWLFSSWSFNILLHDEFRASPPVLSMYVTLQKYFSHPSLIMYCFATPPIKTAYMWELLIANRLHQSLMIDQSKIGSSSWIIFITLFTSQYTALLEPFTSFQQINPKP